jgi:hypothetical protein
VANKFFSLYVIIPSALGPGFHSVSNRNYYQEKENSVSLEQSAAERRADNTFDSWLRRILLSSPQRLHFLWASRSLLSNGYCGRFGDC